MLRHGFTHARPIHGFAFVEVGLDAQARGRALARMLEVGRRRQAIIVVADGWRGGDPAHERIVMHGRSVVVSTGPAIVARLTGAAIVPMASTLLPGRILVEAFEPVVAGPDDGETTRRLARFFERRIEDAPGRLWRPSLDELRAAPLASR
jgi:lauroyl/myristoyl acyltransferase